eukprot:4276140-Ditylum_brightwellii.AAC.1
MFEGTDIKGYKLSTKRNWNPTLYHVYQLIQIRMLHILENNTREERKRQTNVKEVAKALGDKTRVQKMELQP